MATLGQQVIGELGRRGQRGMYFTYREYVELRGVADADGLKAFLDRVGYVGIPTTTSVRELVDILHGVEAELQNSAVFRSSGFAMLLLALGGLPLIGDAILVALMGRDGLGEYGPWGERKRATALYLAKLQWPRGLTPLEKRALCEE